MIEVQCAMEDDVGYIYHTSTRFAGLGLGHHPGAYRVIRLDHRGRRARNQVARARAATA